MVCNKHPRLRRLASAPFVWLMIVPLVILDVFIEIYHHTCFPLYEIPLVKRSRYIKIDRQKLEYLTWIEKICCAYCGYGNGLLQYSAEIAGQTEKYWCGIKHKKYADFIEPRHQKDFVDYGDEIAFKKMYPKEEDKRGSKKPFKLSFRDFPHKIFS